MDILVLSQNGYNEQCQLDRLRKVGVAKGHSIRVLPLKGYAITTKTDGTLRATYQGEEYKADVILPRVKSPDLVWAKPLIMLLENQFPMAVCGVDAMEICHDKMSTFLTLANNGIATPNTVMISHDSQFEYALSSLDVNNGIAIKTSDGAEGAGVFLFDKMPERGLLASVTRTLLASQPILMQERVAYIDDIRVIVIDGKCVFAGKRIPRKGELRANISLGGTYEEYELTEQQRSISIKAAKVTQMKAAAVDLLQTTDTTYVLEVNVAPGFKIDEQLGTNVAGAYIDHAVSCIT